jgi:hypothetical protein
VRHEDVIVYYISGRQLGPLSVPKSWCEECDLTLRAVEIALTEADPQGQLQFAAKPWLAHALPALLCGGWHPPVVLIDGKIFSQGIVPARTPLIERLRQQVDQKQRVSLDPGAAP